MDKPFEIAAAEELHRMIRDRFGVSLCDSPSRDDEAASIGLIAAVILKHRLNAEAERE